MMLDQINYLAELSHQGYRLLTPNQRLASYLTQTINSQQANKACVWETVSAQSYDDFLSAVYKQFLAKNLKAPKTVLDSCSETWLWEQAIEQIESESGHIGLLNKQGAAQEAMRSYRLLLNWNVSISDHDFVLNAHRDSRQFLIWAERFELLLKQKNVLTKEQMQHWIIQENSADSYLNLCHELKSESLTPWGYKLVCVGFQIPSPLQDKLLQRLSATPAEFVAGDNSNDLIYFDLINKDNQQNKSGLHAQVLADSDEHEWRMAARWLFSSHQKNPYARHTVVIPSLSVNRNRVDRVFNEEAHVAAMDASHSMDFSNKDNPKKHNSTPIAFNISSGRALHSVSLVRHWLLLIRAAIGQLSLEESLSLIWSPYSFNHECLKEKTKLTEALYQSNQQEFALTDWLPLMAWLEKKSKPNYIDASEKDSTLKSINPENSFIAVLQKAVAFLSIKRLSNKQQLLNEWLDTFNALTEMFLWSQHRELSSDEYQQREMFLQALREIAIKADIYANISASQAVTLLRRYFKTKVYQAQTIRQQGVATPEVLGVLEASGQLFDAIWLCESSDGEWPPTTNVDSLLPYTFQCDLNMPGTAARENSYARLQSEKLIAASSTFIVSYRKTIDEVETRLSPYLARELLLGEHDTQQLTSRLGEVAANLSEKAFDTSLINKKEITLDLIYDDQGLPYDYAQDKKAQKIMPAGIRMLSDFAKSPLQSYVIHRLKVKPLETFQTGLTPLERGLCLHAVMEGFWLEVKNQAELMALTLEKITQMIDDLLLKSLRQISANRFKAMYPAAISLEKRNLSQIALAWLALDKQRLPFQVESIEQEISFNLHGWQIKGRIDRMDALVNEQQKNELLLVDYKTGNTRLLNWLEKPLTEPQLPLYSLAINKLNKDNGQPSVAVGVAFAGLKVGQIAMQGLVDPKALLQEEKYLTSLDQYDISEVKDWKDLLHYWEQSIAESAQGILDGSASLDVSEDASGSVYQAFIRSGFYQPIAFV